MEWRRDFEWDGVAGTVEVQCAPNQDASTYGIVSDHVLGFPVCSARVQYPRRGYHSMFGWVQLVCATDNDSGGAEFEVDPFDLFGDAHMPYAWYGTEPTLFDAPSRLNRTPMVWRCRSFLATTPMRDVFEGRGRRVVPILGFGWGFDVDDAGSINLAPISELDAGDWTEVLPALRAEYPEPAWAFAEGFASS